MRKKIIAPLLLLASITLTACGAGTSPSTAPQAPPAIATVQADDVQRPFTVKNYDFTYNISCFCAQEGVVKAEVRAGQIVKAIDQQGNVVTHKNQLRTIDAMLEEARNTKGKTKVTWPKESPAPSYIGIDHIINAVDDEMYYYIEEFKEVN